MKKSELKFKVITGTPERAKTIITMLIAAKLSGDIACPSSDQNVICVEEGSVFSNNNLRYIDTIGVQHLPEVTYQQAIDLIAQVGPEAEGEFVECDVDANGMFYVSSQNGCRQKTYWSNVASVECNSCMELVFAGWVWDAIKSGGQPVSALRMGFGADGYLTNGACHWTKPAQPIAVRFWRKYK